MHMQKDILDVSKLQFIDSFKKKRKAANSVYALIRHGSLFLELSLKLFLAVIFRKIKAYTSLEEEKLSN